MKIRGFQPGDETVLESMYKTQGFDYEFPELNGPLMETVLVVTDQDGKILAALAAERLVQLYFLCGEVEHPAVKLCIIRALHEHMSNSLRMKGYGSVEAFLPPQVEKSFGKRLERDFGWKRNWPSWCKEF